MLTYLFILSLSLVTFTAPEPSLSGQLNRLTYVSSKTDSTLLIHFEKISSEKVKSSFKKVLSQYPELQDAEITLCQAPLQSSTMQAQPIVRLSNVFGRTKKYRIMLALMVHDSEEIKVADVPKEVLTGWFAHELGHLVDYHSRNDFQMVLFGFRYLFSGTYKTRAEHTADQVAISHGFRKELIALKRFILENDLIGEDYKKKIRMYYMAIEQVETWQHEAVGGVYQKE